MVFSCYNIQSINMVTKSMTNLTLKILIKKLNKSNSCAVKGVLNLWNLDICVGNYIRSIKSTKTEETFVPKYFSILFIYHLYHLPLNVTVLDCKTDVSKCSFLPYAIVK